MANSLPFFPEDIRLKIINALIECQHTQGYWCYPPFRKDANFVSVWTTAQVLWALQLAGARPRYIEEGFRILLNYDTCMENGELVGWMHENTSELGVCITADCCIACILANKYNVIKNCIDKLLSIQLVNSGEKIGWGYTISDVTSRVTATCWVVSMLLYVAQNSLLVDDKIVDAIKSGVKWLISVATYNNESIGWGEIQGTTPKVSCTAWAIYIILETAKLGYIDINYEKNRKLIASSLNTIKGLYTPQYKGWIGSPEGYKALRMKGLGSSIVLIALIEAADANFLEMDDIYINYALEEIKSEKNGWITPSYKETQVYENVFWLLALSKLERFYLKYSENIKLKFDALNRKYTRLFRWNLRIVSWVVIATIGYIMYKMITLYTNNPFIPILQSIIATFIWEFPLKHIATAILAWGKKDNE